MTYELVIIGAGLSGLTVAHHAAQQGLKTLVVEHENEPGGFTKYYWNHRDFIREKEQHQATADLPCDVWTLATVTGLFPGTSGAPHELYIQCKEGTETVQAHKVVIASGSLEKPREAHRISGSRPAGVMTPMMAINLMKRGLLPGRHVLVIDSGRISRSVAEQLQNKGCDVQVLSGAVDIVDIKGSARLQEVVIRNNDSHEERIACDTLIFNKGRIPSTFFLKGTSLTRDSEYAICVDERGRTNVDRVFAVGSCTALGDDNHLNSATLAEMAIDEIFSTE